MEHRITATELERMFAEVLSAVLYAGDSFVIESGGEPVARMMPLAAASTPTLREAVHAGILIQSSRTLWRT